MQSTGSYLRTLSITHWGLFFLQVVFLLIVIWIIDPEREDEFDLHFIISDTIIIVVGFILAYLMPRKTMRIAKCKLGLREKLHEYKKAILARWCVLLFVSLYSTIAFIMTREYIFVCSTIFSMAVFLLNRVNAEIIGEQLELSTDEQRVLTNPDSAI